MLHIKPLRVLHFDESLRMIFPRQTFLAALNASLALYNVVHFKHKP